MSDELAARKDDKSTMQSCVFRKTKHELPVNMSSGMYSSYSQ